MSPVAGASTRPAAPSAQGVTRSVPALEPSADEGSVPDVSVTIVTYQCKDLVLTCLESLTDGARASQLEVIIVDNGSTDGVVEAVKDRYPDLRVIEVGGICIAPELARGRAWTEAMFLMMQWAFEHMQAKDGGAVYLRLTTRSIPQVKRGEAV